MANTRISEKKVLKIRRTRVQNPVILSWFNSYGTPESWVFEDPFGTSLRVFGAVGNRINEPTIQAFRDDPLRTWADGAEEVHKKEAQDKILLTATNLSQDDVRTIRSLLFSVQVGWLMNFETWETDDPIWQTVRVTEGSYELGDIGRGLYEIQLEITLQDIKNVWQ